MRLQMFLKRQHLFTRAFTTLAILHKNRDKKHTRTRQTQHKRIRLILLTKKIAANVKINAYKFIFIIDNDILVFLKTNATGNIQENFLNKIKSVSLYSYVMTQGAGTKTGDFFKCVKLRWADSN